MSAPTSSNKGVNYLELMKIFIMIQNSLEQGIATVISTLIFSFASKSVSGENRKMNRLSMK